MFIIVRNIVNNILIYLGNPISITKAKISLLVNVKRYRKGKTVLAVVKIQVL